MWPAKYLGVGLCGGDNLTETKTTRPNRRQPQNQNVSRKCVTTRINSRASNTSDINNNVTIYFHGAQEQEVNNNETRLSLTDVSDNVSGRHCRFS